MSDTDYRFITYETLDNGMIARIMLDRVDTRNAQNRASAALDEERIFALYAGEVESGQRP